MAEQRLSLVTLGTRDLARSRRFYTDGFGWTPAFENEEIIFYQLGGIILGTFERGRWNGTWAEAASTDPAHSRWRTTSARARRSSL
ncbi:VOC family protein [Altererythrobacter sp. TH136]|uniref:VOC family protein n=1 Tax=Altererythrobacter sp. TH136 TaxID=2067415 RepID=UPI001FEE8260|nr:VOC family protein [Altererythrobacter sp. TH136]